MNFKGLLTRATGPLVVIGVLLFWWALSSWFSPTLAARPWVVMAGLAFLAALILWLIGRARAAATNSQSNQVRDALLILVIVLVLLVGGWTLTSAANTLAAEALRAAALRIAILWAAACFMAGFLVGFLFGVPKVGPEEDASRKPAGSARSGANDTQGYSQRPNTNLEQISDWLTKIIVGLGLVELKQIPVYLGNAARWVAESLSVAAPNPATISFAGSLILYFSILGFLAGYLLTLLFLAGAFGRAGRQAYAPPDTIVGEDADSARIRNFWRPNGGPPDPENTRKLTEWIPKNMAEGTTITELITARDFDKEREKAIADLNIA